MDNEADSANLRLEMLRGDNAKRLLEDELFIGAFAAVRADLQNKLFNTLPSQSADREKLYLSYLLLEKVEFEITHHVTTGKLARKSLGEIAKDAVRRAAEPLRKRFAA